jgi:hypothetical protein
LILRKAVGGVNKKEVIAKFRYRSVNRRQKADDRWQKVEGRWQRGWWEGGKNRSWEGETVRKNRTEYLL